MGKGLYYLVLPAIETKNKFILSIVNSVAFCSTEKMAKVLTVAGTLLGSLNLSFGRTFLA